MNQHEAVVGAIHDLQNGEMKQVDVNGTPMLLARVDDQFYACVSGLIVPFAKL